ncbi:MAG: hypothetical protein MUP16_00885 [Sedimentisphaerales bacterium]|nr:hypothetical protein [Sedimentisphaerales bacterium]
MEKMTVKELMDKLKNANPDSPIDVELNETGKTERIDMFAVEITATGVTIHGDITMVTHESNSEYEDRIVGMVADNIKNDGITRDAIIQVINQIDISCKRARRSKG